MNGQTGEDRIMRKQTLGILISLLLLIAVVVPVAAITYGAPDKDHPYVGLVGFFDEDGNWLWRCSGTLLSKKIFLTAGHCTSPDFPYNPEVVPDSARVWFGDKIELDPILYDYPDLECYEDAPDGRKWTGYPCVGGVKGTPIANPEFIGLYLPDTHDVGIVLLKGPLPEEAGTEFGQLPDVGLLDRLATQRGAQDTTFISVGYGLNQVKPTTISLRERWYSESHLINLTNALTDGFNIQTSNNPGKWPEDPMSYSGGTCSGDSGGPLFYTYEGVEYVVGITSFGLNSYCKGTDFAYRTDTLSARDFIDMYFR
jgi:hypothetical protein